MQAVSAIAELVVICRTCQSPIKLSLSRVVDLLCFMYMQGGVMFPDSAKLYMAPISDSQCYDERFYFCRNSVIRMNNFYAAVCGSVMRHIVAVVCIKCSRGSQLITSLIHLQPHTSWTIVEYSPLLINMCKSLSAAFTDAGLSELPTSVNTGTVSVSQYIVVQVR